MKAWLNAARYALTVCGVGSDRLPQNEAERASLQSLRRGVFARSNIQAGTVVTGDDVYFAFPPQEGQYTANDWSKYAAFTTTHAVAKDGALSPVNTSRADTRDQVWDIAKKVAALIKASGIAVPGGIDLEISHHYGLEKFEQTGLTLLTIVNRAYCKKLLVSLPGQHHPEQYHRMKEETFHVLHGEVHLFLNGEKRICRVGDVVNIEPGMRHAFVSPTGSIIEEISSTHHKDDSFYTDESIMRNTNRKTLLTYWMG